MEGEMEVKLDAGKTTRYNRKYRHKYGHQCWWKTHEIASRIGLGVTVGQMFRCSSRSPLLLCVRLVGGQLSLFLGQWACCILVRYDWCLQKALAESHIASDSFHTLTNTEPHAYDCYWLRLAFLWLGFALTKSRESGMEIARKMWEAGGGMWNEYNESELDMLTFDGLFAKCLTTQDWSLGHFVVWAPDAGCSRQYGWGRSGYRLNLSGKNSRDGVLPKFNLNIKTGMGQNGTFCSLPFFASLEETSHTTWSDWLRGFLMG